MACSGEELFADRVSGLSPEALARIEAVANAAIDRERAAERSPGSPSPHPRPGGGAVTGAPFVCDLTTFVPAATIPEDDDLRERWLRTLFPDHVVSSAFDGERWTLSLARPEDPSWYVDPALADGLEWWASGTTAANIPFAVRRCPTYQLAMDDSWSLVAWSRWLRDRAVAGRPVTDVVLLHADQHDDLASPHLFCAPHGWRDPIAGHAVDFTDPEAVAGAVSSGAVGIASYIVPLLHVVPTVHMRHLRAGDRAPETGPRLLAPVRLDDPAMGPDAVRPGLRVVDAGSLPDGSPRTFYSRSRSAEAWLEALPEAPVLLHLDLDYLNNRYDGGSATVASGERHDPGADDVMDNLDSMFEALNLAKCRAQIVDVTVALSPGFFPVELWPATVGRLERRLDELIEGHKSWPPH